MTWTIEEITAWIETLTETEAAAVLVMAKLIHAMGYSRHETMCLIREAYEHGQAVLHTERVH